MLNRICLFFVAPLTALSLQPFSSAQQEPVPVPRGPTSFITMFNRADTDSDGKLTPEEVSSKARGISKALFRAIDTNGDQTLSRDEIELAERIDQYKGPAKRIQFEGKEWVADHALGAEVVEYKGKQALHVVGRERSLVYLPINDFQNGTIEVDIAGSLFSGIGFRGREKGQRAEKLYFRPQIEDEDRFQHKVQYSVIGRNDGHWSYLRENFPGKYEAAADIHKGAWFHVRLEIKGESLKVFVDDSPQPVLVVDPMLDGVSRGSVGVWGWNSYFANFKYTRS